MPQDNANLTDCTTRWNVAQERAKRANRNLLQYGAALAAMLTAFGSIAGILGIADAMRGTQKDPTILFATSSGVFTIQSLIVTLSSTGACLFLILVLAILISLMQRAVAEAEAEKQLRSIIAIQPDRFLPKGSGE